MKRIYSSHKSFQEYFQILRYEIELSVNAFRVNITHSGVVDDRSTHHTRTNTALQTKLNFLKL